MTTKTKGKKKRLKNLFSSFSNKKVSIGLVLLSLGLVIIFYLLISSLPSPKKLSTFQYPASTLILDRNNNLLYQIYDDKNRVLVKFDDLPDHLIKATLAIEDKNFYKHHGFDLKGIARAGYNTLLKRKLQGGSTLTQQLVKNALLTPERTIQRKIKEAILTLAAEAIYSKDQILEMYFNQTPYGGTAWGVEAAAKTFFEKTVNDLSLAESALLAGLPASPTKYSPFAHPDLALERQRMVLDIMLETEAISEEEYKQAREEDLAFTSPGTKISAPHFVFYVKEKLVEKYGQAVVDQGGLMVKTSLDLEIQNFAQQTVASEIEKLERYNVTNGALLVTQPKTGEILAMVGSKDYFAEDIDGKFNVTTALRQPGSSIKPINYATGFLLNNATPATVFNDVPTCFLVAGQKAYCPKNYDGLFHGSVQLRFALGNSFNIPAVKMLGLNGLESFIATASAMGIESFKDSSQYGLSLTLGGGEVKMTEMATAFGTLANGGIRQDLVSILEIKDRNGNILEEYQKGAGKRVIPMEAAYLVSHILLDNGARSAAFGSYSELVVKGHPEVSVKTGTTNDRRDNWTIGYNPGVTVTVWVGNNDNSSMSAVASGVTGASPIWNKTISYILEDQKQEWPIKPANIIGKTVCNLTGLLPPPEGCSSRFEYFIKGTEPTSIESLRQTILIDKDTNSPVQPGEDKKNVEFQEHPIVVDPFGIINCLDCQPTENKTTIRISDTKSPFITP